MSNVAKITISNAYWYIHIHIRPHNFILLYIITCQKIPLKLMQSVQLYMPNLNHAQKPCKKKYLFCLLFILAF